MEGIRKLDELVSTNGDSVASDVHTVALALLVEVYIYIYIFIITKTNGPIGPCGYMFIYPTNPFYIFF